MRSDSHSDVLAVVVPHYGQPTETFIKRYCLEICPERTVLAHFYPGSGHWRISGPVYSLPIATFGSIAVWKAFRGLQKLCGIHRLFGDPYTTHSLASFLHQHRVTCVFSQYLSAAWNVHAVVKRLGLRHVIRGHGFDVSSALENQEWRRRYHELADADAIVVPSPYQVERLRQIGLTDANLIPVPCGVDIPVTNSPAPIEAGNSLVRILAVGRMVAKKAPIIALQAFLMASKSCTNLQLNFIGGGPLELMVKDYVKRHDQLRRIQVLGAKPHSDVLRAMRESDIFLQHSVTDPTTGDQEGAPVAILEAMAQGLPVISTFHSGIPYLVEHGVTGLLTPEGDATKMAASIELLARSVELRRSMGAAGRSRAQEFSWARERATLIKVLFPKRTTLDH